MSALQIVSRARNRSLGDALSLVNQGQKLSILPPVDHQSTSLQWENRYVDVPNICGK